MNGFTTTETDATKADLALQAERVKMACAEGGYPLTSIRIGDDGVFVVTFADGLWKADPIGCTRAHWRACDLVGRPHRCIPCGLHTPLGGPRVSPDCEGTGRCGVES